MRENWESARALKIKLLSWFLLPLLVSLGAGLRQEMVANQMDENFDLEFREIYGLDGDDFFWLGEDGLVGRWLSDDQVQARDCEFFEKCNFVEVASIEGCPMGFSMDFVLYDADDKVVSRGNALGQVLRPGDLITVEIGAEESIEFEFLEPEKAQCLSSGMPA